MFDKAFLPTKYQTFLLILGLSAPCLIWTFFKEYQQAAAAYLYSNVWVLISRSLSANSDGWQNRCTYCYKESNSVIVFLHVTNASTVWQSLEMCAFKLAAIHNNDTGVCVLTAYPKKPHPKLASIRNLQIAPLDFNLLFNDTPLADWYDKYFLRNTKRSRIWMWELSDASRYTYLYKYGGKYMDTDSWTLRNLAPLQNVAGLQNDQVANGVLFFQKGHPLIAAAIDNFTKYFASGRWGSSGPGLMTKLHQSGKIDNSTYTLLPSRTFYPTHYAQYHYPFVPSHNKAVKNMIRGAYTLHLWGYMIRRFWRIDSTPANGSFVAEMLNTLCA